MKTKKQVQDALNDCALSTDEMELWDGEPDLYICQGWQEALVWVLGSRKLKTHRPYKPRRSNNE